ATGRAVAERVRTFYGRDVAAVHPPVAGRRFAVERRPGGYYLVISRLVEPKRIELAVEAARGLGRRLIVVGRGRREPALRRLAGPMTTFLGWVPDDDLPRLYAGARALLQPGEEDFGLAAL